MSDPAERPVSWLAVAIWAAVATVLAVAVSGGDHEPALFVEVPVLAAMLAFVVACQAFPVGDRGLLERLLFLVAAAVGQVALTVVLAFLLMPLWYVSPFLGVVLGCVLAALPFVSAATRGTTLFVTPNGELTRVGRRPRAR